MKRLVGIGIFLGSMVAALLGQPPDGGVNLWQEQRPEALPANRQQRLIEPDRLRAFKLKQDSLRALLALAPLEDWASPNRPDSWSIRSIRPPSSSSMAM